VHRDCDSEQCQHPTILNADTNTAKEYGASIFRVEECGLRNWTGYIGGVARINEDPVIAVTT
jgi:hypothetical protein